MATDDLETLRAEVERLRDQHDEALDLLDCAMCQGTFSKIVDGVQWVSGGAVSTWDDIGGYLVAAGRWERHPEKAWLYRRKETT